jgi:hypothetical protein
LTLWQPTLSPSVEGLENRCQFQIRNGAKNINVKIWYKKENFRLERTQTKQIKIRLLPVVAV